MERNKNEEKTGSSILFMYMCLRCWEGSKVFIFVCNILTGKTSDRKNSSGRFSICYVHLFMQLFLKSSLLDNRDIWRQIAFWFVLLSLQCRQHNTHARNICGILESRFPQVCLPPYSLFTIIFEESAYCWHSSQRMVSRRSLTLDSIVAKMSFSCIIKMYVNESFQRGFGVKCITQKDKATKAKYSFLSGASITLGNKVNRKYFVFSFMLMSWAKCLFTWRVRASINRRYL